MTIRRSIKTVSGGNITTGISFNKNGICTLSNDATCADFKKQKWNCVKDNLKLTDLGIDTGSKDITDVFGTGGDYKIGDTITYCDQECGNNQQNTDGIGCMCGGTFLEKGFKCVDNKIEKLSAPAPTPVPSPAPITKTEQPVITPVSSVLLVAILFVIISFMLIRNF